MGRMVDTPQTVTPGRWQGCHSRQYGARHDGSQHNRTPLPGPGRSGRHGPDLRRTRTRKGQRELGLRNACVCLNCSHYRHGVGRFRAIGGQLPNWTSEASRDSQ